MGCQSQETERTEDVGNVSGEISRIAEFSTAIATPFQAEPKAQLGRTKAEFINA